MPSGDRTGPMGQGSMTGKALGFCEGNETPGYHRGFGAGMGRGFGFGRGMSRGRGFGFGRYWNWFSAGLAPLLGWHSAFSKDDEIKVLKSQADMLKRSQADIEKRISDLESPKNQDQ